MQEDRSRLQSASHQGEKLEDRYGSIALPALKAALDAGKALTAPEPVKQMSSQLPEKWRQFEAQS